MKNDPTYYSELAMGAEYLAARASCATERAEHLRMARLYRLRAEDAAPATRPTLH
jgi:hypothetical protein